MSAANPELLQFPLKVTFTAMSDRTRALLEYYIQRSENRFFMMCGNSETPDVIMIDHDHPGTAERLASSKWRSDIALVVLAAADRQVEGAIMVPKPLNSGGLDTAAAIALEQLKRSPATTDSNDQVAKAHGSILSIGLTPAEGRPRDNEQPATSKKLTRASATGPDKASTPAYFRTSDAALPAPSALPIPAKIERYRAKIDLLCGPKRTLDDFQDADNTEHRFDPTRSISTQACTALSTAKPDVKAVQFKLPDSNIYVFPTLQRIYTTVSLEYKRNVDRLFRDWHEDDIQILEYDNNNVNQLIDVLNQSTRYSFSAQSFSWLSALFSSRGRLPLGFDIHRTYRLRHWPNFTRLELIPDCLEISAAWSEQSATVAQIIERVQCEPRYAVSFLNAARSIELMVPDDADER